MCLLDMYHDSHYHEMLCLCFPPSNSFIERFLHTPFGTTCLHLAYRRSTICFVLQIVPYWISLCNSYFEINNPRAQL